MIKRKSRIPVQQKSPRLWPGIVSAILILVFKFVTPLIVPDAMPVTILGSALCGLLALVWWAFFSRLPRFERWSALVLIIAALIAVRPLLHQTIANGGMGMLFPILALPILSLVLIAWALAASRIAKVTRRITLAAAILLAVFAWTLIRTGGIDNAGNSDFAWRWSQSAEEQLLAQAGNKPTTSTAITVTETVQSSWPGFRGPNRKGILHGSKITTDWTVNPPQELWRRPVGPGWSSFSVRGDLFYTQEQRGEDEVVSCYNLNTGAPVWIHRDKARFWESNSGAGPRATPTISNGLVYSLGATGILNVLDANDGRMVWSHNAAADTDTKIPIWGFSSSPLVVDNLVIVATAGSLIAYDLVSGKSRWTLPAEGNECYSSPHLLQIDGVTQVLLQNAFGVISATPGDGTLLWQHAWKGASIVQPAMTADGDLLISVNERGGMRRLTATLTDTGWSIQERWTSARIKPYFNDSVVHNGYIYGFDGPTLACIDAKDGVRMWKGGRYGRGQFVLLADQDLLLVISEKGELALVNAIPEQFTELARVPAITGKTWNHPVLVDDILLIRNGQEMAAFRLAQSE